MKDKRNGFTLVELLIVIAVIAVIAAILFPVFGRVREATRQSSCMSNMHSIWIAAKLYKQDYSVYPCMLLGPAETVNGYAWTPGSAQPPVPASQMKHAYLYPNYVKSIDVFHCPDNPDNNLQKVTTACYAPGSPMVQYLINKTGHDEPTAPALQPGTSSCVRNFDPNTNYNNVLAEFYVYDSYDISSAVLPDGSRQPQINSNLGCYIVYTKKWTTPDSIGQRDASNQMLYPDAPPDSTVLTWCNYHVTTAHGDKSPVILISGTVKPRDYKQVLNNGWKVASKN